MFVLEQTLLDPEQAMNQNVSVPELSLTVPEQTINKELSVSEQTLLVPEQAIILLNVVRSGTNIAGSGTSNEPKRVSSGTVIDCSLIVNRK